MSKMGDMYIQKMVDDTARREAEMLQGMKAKEWAQRLNGREYGEEMTRGEERQAKADGVIIIFGYSDDNVEFRGVINDEAGSYDGTTVRLTPNLTIFNEDENSETFEFNAKQIEQMKSIEVVWCPKDEEGNVWASWCYNTDIPHETFDIMEDGDLYCRGIVFDAKYFSEGSV